MKTFNKLKKREIVILSILLIIGFAYRIYELNHDSYWIDESYTIIASKNIGTYGYPKFDSNVNYMGAFPQSYSLFILGELFGYTHFPMRILSVIIGTAFIALIYFLVRRFYDYKIALLSSALITFSYLQIAWSRQARSYIFLEFLCFLSIYFYLCYLEESHVKYAILTAFGIVLSYIFSPLGLVLIPILGIHLLLIRNTAVFEDMKTFFNNIKLNKYLILIGTALFTLLLYYIMVNLGNIKVVADYFSEYKYYLFQTTYLLICLAVIGIFSFKKYLKYNLLYILLFFSVFVAVSFTINMRNFRYIFIALPVITILASQAMIYFYELYKNKIYKIFIVVSLVCLLLFSQVLFLPKNSYALEVETPQPPFEDAYTYVKENIVEGDILIVTQPAISALYFKKADYWLAIGYEGRGINDLYNKNNLGERYTNITSIINEIMLKDALAYGGYIIIDDMGIQRLSSKEREIVLNLTLEKKYGTTYWNTVYVYHFKKT